MKRAFLISNIEEYGFLVAYCVEHDISVFRSYWDDREKGNRCYFIDFYHKKLFYFRYSTYDSGSYEIACPVFDFNEFGNVVIRNFHS